MSSPTEAHWQDLAYEIVKQAVDDWRGLCKGKKESKHCNFKELEHFFEHDCAKYMTNAESADRIFAVLKCERRKAVNNGTIQILANTTN